MGLKTTNILPKNTLLVEIKNLILLLGYKETRRMKRKNIHFYRCVSKGEEDAQVELIIFETPINISVNTNSNQCIDSWHSKLQYITTNALKNNFGGKFYLSEIEKEKILLREINLESIHSKLLRQYEKFMKRLEKIELYLNSKYIYGREYNGELTEIDFIDSYNPELLSNNFTLIYLVSIWEVYLMDLFRTLLEYSPAVEGLVHKFIESFDVSETFDENNSSILQRYAESLSFSKLKDCKKHFYKIDSQLNLFQLFEASLFLSIERIIERRHGFLLNSTIDYCMTDTKLKAEKDILKSAASCIYSKLSKYYK